MKLLLQISPLNVLIAKAIEQLSDLILFHIWVTFVVADHSLMKSLSLVFKTTETPGFLFKFWEVLLILPRFSFCVYFGCSPRILILAVFWFAHLGELSLSFSHLGDLLALITCILRNIYLHPQTVPPNFNCLLHFLHFRVPETWYSAWNSLF